MIIKLRPALSTLTLALTLAVFAAPGFVGALQSSQGMANDRGHDQDNRQYGRDGQYDRDDNIAAHLGSEDGWNDGRRDYQKQHSYRPTEGDNYRNATHGFMGGPGQTSYQAAYRQAYITAYREGYSRQSNSRYGQTNPYNHNGSLAAQMGSQDGLNDGRSDRQTGHSNRPTQGDNYKDATRGFRGGAGETAYKAAYRQAYLPAYQEGYTSRNSIRR